jgi:hypothetical protein
VFRVITASKQAMQKAMLPTGTLWPKMVDFERFDPIQVRYVGHEWREGSGNGRQVSKSNIKGLRSGQLRAWLPNFVL